MAMGSGLLALAMLAAQGPSCPPESATTFQVRVLTIDGLDWRTSSYSRLQPVARQGSSTVWTADKALVVTLSERARSTTNFGTVVSTSDATLTKCEAVNYVAAVERFADGPINQSSAIAFLPKPERLDERFAIKLAGRKLDQGILTQVALEETHVEVIHAIPQTESVLPCPAKTTRTPTEIGCDIVSAMMSPKARESGPSLTCSVQVPEITQAKVEGEWLIPNNGVLLVSLGVKTVADDQGKAVVRERVAVIEGNPVQMPASTQLSAVKAVSPAPMPFASAKLAMPAMPARSMPLPISPNGDVAEGDLPPLPEALASTDLDRIKPAPYQPSPQSPIISGPARDTELARTSFEAVPPMEKAAAETDVENEKAESRIAFLEKVIDALERAGVNIDINIESNSPVFKPIKPVCDKCEGQDPNCPAQARFVKGEPVAGGLTKIAPEVSARLGVSVQDPRGMKVFGGVANLSEALKTPGRTETTLIPIGDKVALEIKTTVVPASPEKANTSTSKNPEVPTTKR